MNEDKKPFNDVIDHMDKIEGNISNLSKANLDKLPKPLKFFGYFVFGFFAISLLLGIIVPLFQ